MKKNKAKKFIFSTRNLCILTIPLLGISSYNIHKDTQIKQNELESKKNSIQEQHDTLVQEKEQLKSQIELFKNDEYILSYAKSKLMRVADNEVLFLFPNKTTNKKH